MMHYGGIKRKFKVVNWTAYSIAKRRFGKASIKDYATIHTLEYIRIPGYDRLTQRQYALLMEKS